MVGGIFQRFLLRKTPLHRFGIEHALSSSSGGSQATGTPCKEVGGGQVFSISEFRKFHVTPQASKTNDGQWQCGITEVFEYSQCNNNNEGLWHCTENTRAGGV